MLEGGRIWYVWYFDCCCHFGGRLGNKQDQLALGPCTCSCTEGPECEGPAATTIVTHNTFKFRLSPCLSSQHSSTSSPIVHVLLPLRSHSLLHAAFHEEGVGSSQAGWFRLINIYEHFNIDRFATPSGHPRTQNQTLSVTRNTPSVTSSALTW